MDSLTIAFKRQTHTLESIVTCICAIILCSFLLPSRTLNIQSGSILIMSLVTLKIMSLHADLNAAQEAVRTAFKTALDSENYNESDLSELWRHYLGIKAIAKKQSPTSDGIYFSSSIAAGPVDTPLWSGEDKIVFNYSDTVSSDT